MNDSRASRLLILALSIAPYCLQPSPTLAQGEKDRVRFYCSLSQDGKLTPLTFVGIRGSKAEHRQLVKWSDYKNQTADQRCQAGSKRFQAAWDRGDFHKLKAQVDPRSGEGIICALGYRQLTCDRAHQLFVLKSAKDGQEVIAQLMGTMRGTSGSAPTSQSSGFDEIDMQQLIESIDRHQIKPDRVLPQSYIQQSIESLSRSIAN